MPHFLPCTVTVVDLAQPGDQKCPQSKVHILAWPLGVVQAWGNYLTFLGFSSVQMGLIIPFLQHRWEDSGVNVSEVPTAVSIMK